METTEDAAGIVLVKGDDSLDQDSGNADGEEWVGGLPDSFRPSLSSSFGTYSQYHPTSYPGMGLYWLGFF